MNAMVNVGDWVEFDYTDKNGVQKVWRGEITEWNVWGYKIYTMDGYRSFNFGRMKNIKQLA